MPLKPITIIGGGLAGLTLGLGLRGRDVPVTVFETGRYPRHRVCGEFISGRGLAVLERLALREPLMKAGAIVARNTVFYFGNISSPPRTLEPAALGLSRYKLDALLAELFRRRGGVLRESASWRESVLGEGIVRATGRRVQPVTNGWRWFGLKTHARRVNLAADLEMHCLPNQYVGISRIEDDKVNVCGLFRRHVADSKSPRSGRDSLLGAPGSLLHSRLENAVLDDDSFCSVAGLPLQPQRAAGRAECCIGDALTMIPPATGNGMSMAFEAADAAVGPLEAYSRNAVSWDKARQNIARTCDKLFRCRLWWGTWLQLWLFSPCIQGSAGRVMLNSERLWKLFYTMTR
jgi:menaquinone-9 beta-reductase